MQFKSLIIGALFFAFVVGVFGSYYNEMATAYDKPLGENFDLYENISASSATIQSMQEKVRSGQGSGTLTEIAATGGLLVINLLFDFVDVYLLIINTVSSTFNLPAGFVSFIILVLIVTIIGYVLKTLFKVGE